MVTKFFIENFRSIEKAEIDLGKITVLTGANNSGKSSVIYALLALRNILTNPNQSIDNLLNLPSINLGGFEQVVYLKDKYKSIELVKNYKLFIIDVLLDQNKCQRIDVESIILPDNIIEKLKQPNTNFDSDTYF